MKIIIKVSSKSNCKDVAGALVGYLNENPDKEIEMICIGAGALNQTVKAIAIARGYVAASGINLGCIPAFTNITIDGQERTAMKMILKEM